jgi:hypothetical protein
MPRGISADNEALGSSRGGDLRCSEFARSLVDGRGPVLICEVGDTKVAPSVDVLGIFAPMAGLSPSNSCFEPVSLAMLSRALVGG